MRKSKAAQIAKGMLMYHSVFRKGLPFFIRVLEVVAFGN